MQMLGWTSHAIELDCCDWTHSITYRKLTGIAVRVDEGTKHLVPRSPLSEVPAIMCQRERAFDTCRLTLEY